jgi:hypothetical protein
MKKVQITTKSQLEFPSARNKSKALQPADA